MMKLLSSLATALALAGATPAAETGLELVIWNQHNGAIHDRGSKTCTVELFKGTTSMWKRANVALEWSRDGDAKTTVPMPQLAFAPDRLRVSITQWIGLGGGLAELELLRGGVNFAREGKATASASFDKRFRAEKVNDGIVSSADNFVGYWLLPDKTKGWIDLQFPQK